LDVSRKTPPNPLVNAASGAIPFPVPSLPPPELPSLQPPSLSLTQISSSETSDLDSWQKIYRNLYRQELNEKTEDILSSFLAGEGGTSPTLPGDFSSLAFTSPTSPNFWGGFTPSYAQTTGNFLGDLAKSFQTTIAALSGLKDFAKLGVLLGMPFGPALAVLGALSFTESSSLNPVNNPAIRQGLMELFDTSTRAQSLFGSKKAFEGFLGGMFGYGSALKGITPPKNLSSYYQELLGYVPTTAQLNTMRANALNSVRGLAMALNPQTASAFNTYKDFANKVREYGFLNTYPTFHEFAEVFDIATHLGVTPKAIAPAIVFDYHTKYNIEDFLDEKLRPEILQDLLDFSNRMYARLDILDIQDLTSKLRNNEITWNDWAERVLEAYARLDEARRRNISYLDVEEAKDIDQAIESFFEGLKEQAENLSAGLPSFDVASFDVPGVGSLSVDLSDFDFGGSSEADFGESSEADFGESSEADKDEGEDSGGFGEPE